MTTSKLRQTALQPLPGLADRMAEQLQARITAGAFKPGERLPPEHELAVAFGVSRTVVREGVTRLKADGLIVSRRGSGAYVSDGVLAGPFRISDVPDASLESVLKLVELRMGVESQSAALAAERASPAQLQRMKRALVAMANAVDRGGDGVEADVRFHRLVAEATGNPHIRAFLEFLGRHLSAQIRVSRLNTAHYPGRARLVLEEHRAIYDAIAARDAHKARAMAARHLDGTIKRLQAPHRSAQDPPETKGAAS